MKVLLIEDDVLLGDGVCKALRQTGFTVDWVLTKGDASAASSTHAYDLLVLDVNLPDGNGFDFLTQLRARHSKTPVLILTALSQTPDRIRGLNLGADDYMVKPFDIDELSARIRALHRRSQGVATPAITIRSVTLDAVAHLVSHHGEPIELGAKEFAILQTLFESVGRVITKDVLEEKLYSWGEEVSSNAVEVLVHRLRKKLGNDVVRTIRGVGYITEAEGE